MHANSLAVTLQRWCEYVHQMGDTRCICTQHSSVGMRVLSELGSAESLLAYFLYEVTEESRLQAAEIKL